MNRLLLFIIRINPIRRSCFYQQPEVVMTLKLQALVVEVAIHEEEETYMYKTVIFKSERSVVQVWLPEWI